MIVQHRQRMTPSRSHREVALEIHLPKIVRRGMFEPRPLARLTRPGTVQPIVATQDLGDRRGRRRIVDPIVLQDLADLAPAPRRMIAANRKHPLLHRRRCPLRTAQWSSRLIGQPSSARRRKTPYPLVGCRRGYAPPATKLTHVRPRHKRQATKLLPLVQQRTLLEWHRRSSHQ